MNTQQLNLFGGAKPDVEGLLYQENFLAPDEEQEILSRIAPLPFEEFKFVAGFLGKRRVVSFGWRYDYNERGVREADDIPDFLLPLRERAATLASLKASELKQVLVTEYRQGAGIGWHKDKAVFGRVVGISLLSPCVFRFRRSKASGWQRASIKLAPRSAYLLSGPARSEWEHSIPPHEQLRYSITFRSFKDATPAA